MRFRRVAAVVAAAAIVPLVASALSGCDTKVGTAGVVSGDRISEATVSSYVTPKAQSVQLNNGQTIAAYAVLRANQARGLPMRVKRRASPSAHPM